MRAAIIDHAGKGSALRIADVPVPEIADGEVLVRVAFCGLNHLDLLIKDGRRPGPESFPHILGSELSGIVEKTGSRVKNVRRGDAVAVYPWTFCGTCRQCASGQEPLCDSGGTLGRTRWGGYAEFAAVPARNLVRLGSDASLKNACAVTLASLTAYHLIFGRARVREKSTVLITGASGGVGTAAIQLAKSLGCTIICTTGRPQKNAMLRKLGAHHVFDVEDFERKISAQFPQGVDYAIDTIGGRVWTRAITCLGKGGTLAFCATTLEDEGRVIIGRAFARQLSILGSYGGTVEEFTRTLGLLRQKKLQPVIDSVFPLAQASQALEKLTSRGAVGKILLQCTPQ